MDREIKGVSRSTPRNSDKRRNFRPVGEILKLRQGRILKMGDQVSDTWFQGQQGEERWGGLTGERSQGQR